jgi:hypothetical protein
MNPGANLHPRRRRRHHRISDPTQPRTLTRTQILTATTDNPGPASSRAHSSAVSLTAYPLQTWRR